MDNISLQLTPKTLMAIMPSYYSVFYLDAALQRGIDSLKETQAILDRTPNYTAHDHVVEAIAALQAMRSAMRELQQENDREAHQIQMEAAHQQHAEQIKAQPRFGDNVDLDEGDD